MKLYNTYSEKLETLNLKQKIGIYVCGVTPDGPTHLGHGFTFASYDILVRYLRFLEANVTYVQNVTNIDDDILIRSKAAKTTWQNMGQVQTKKHLEDMDNLNILRPDSYPKATENIPQMIKIIEKLITKKLAYTKNGSVYFEVKKDKNFGKLSRFGYRAMLEISNERGNYPLDPNKRDPLDFVLWQAKKAGEPSWKSPWGEGRPGWHIECSAMSMRFLGSNVTIHGGGSDLIFPHHEAEIAQSENFSGQKFVNVWMHCAMVYEEGKKMSKSLGNIVFLGELIKKYNANTIRVLLLSHHYRQPWNFDYQELATAKKIADKLTGVKSVNLKPIELKKTIPAFFQALDNDLDTPRALKILEKAAGDKSKSKVVSQAASILGFV